MKCGHKFCSPCFQRMKSYSENSNTAFVCPVDRDIIDLNKVFEDNGVNRVIGDLMIKCVNNTTGCLWTGELRDMEGHEERCEHGVGHKLFDPKDVQKVEENSSLLKELFQRMEKCEEDLMEKGKDVAFLKFNLQETKKELNDKSLEVDFLKTENKNLKYDLKEIKNQNIELKQVEVKMKNISLKNTILEQKVHTLENQLLQIREKLEDHQVELAVVKGDIQDVKNTTEHNVLQINVAKGEVEDLNEMLKQLQLQSQTNKDLKTLNDNLDKSLTEKIEQCASEGSQKIKVLKEHIRNVENIIFSVPSGKEIILQWKLQNYKHHFERGKIVRSPVFCTQVISYCFQFYVNWNGQNKENLDVGLQLCKGSEYDEVLEPFNVPHT